MFLGISFYVHLQPYKHTIDMVFKYDFLIIGAGVAGMSYALKIARAHRGKVMI